MVKLLAVGMVLLSSSAVLAQSGICSSLSESQVRTLTGVPTGAYSQHATAVGAGHSRCTYGVTDGNLVLDVYHLQTDAAAVAMMPKFGDVTNSDNFTTSPYGTDQINQLRSVISEDAESTTFVFGGWAARHGSTIVTIGLNKPGSPSGPEANKRLQGVALQLAGATLAPWPKEDLCARVPPSAVQTLVTLGPATVKQTENSSQGGNSACEYVFTPLSDLNSNFQRSVAIKGSRYINDEEALADKKSGEGAPLLVQVGGARGRVIALDRDHRDLSVLYGGEVGQVLVYQREDAAKADPGYLAHLQKVAFQATGAAITSTTAFPSAKEPSAMDWAWHGIKLFVTRYGWLLIVVLVIAAPFWFRHRRNVLIRTGLRGRAVVLSVADTGVTVNNNPRVRFRLEVHPEGGSPYEATISQTVSRLQAPANLVGQTVEVRIDPKDPQSMVMLP